MRDAECILAGDVGGTKTVLALFAASGAGLYCLEREVYSSQEFPSLPAAVARFLSGRGRQPVAACFGAAGPVIDGRVQVTNLPWVLAEGDLSREWGGMPVFLLNDLQALGEGIPHLPERDRDTLSVGRPAANGVLAVIAPGTGLGEAFMIWDGERYRTLPSEGGHADFAPADELQGELLSFLRRRLGHVSVERVCSGSGVPNLYEFLRQSGRFPEPERLRAEIAAAVDATPVIIGAAQAGSSPICRAVLDLFLAILAAEAANLALKVLATGGVFLGGGLPPRLLPQLREKTFIERFSAKGRFAELLRGIPIQVIVNPDAALLGAAHFGWQQHDCKKKIDLLKF